MFNNLQRSVSDRDTCKQEAVIVTRAIGSHFGPIGHPIHVKKKRSNKITQLVKFSLGLVIIIRGIP